MISRPANLARLLVCASLASIGAAQMFGQTGPELILNDGVGDVATIAANGTCTGACSGLVVTTATGQISVTGSIGPIDFVQLSLSGHAQNGRVLDLSGNLGSTAGGSLTVTASDNGYTEVNPTYQFAPAGTPSGATATFSVYAGTSNSLGDTSGTPLVSGAPAGASATVGSFKPAVNPYSATIVGSFSFTPGGSVVGIDIGFYLTPATLTLACPASSGTVGLPYTGSLVATGGSPPYTFSITSGSLPPALMLNSSTGAITGTPTTEGTFKFTAEVTDSLGDVGTTPAGTTCTITIAPCGTSVPPITCHLQQRCNGGEIVWFNGHLTGLGGNIPHQTFSIYCSGGKIQFGNDTLRVPDGVITFSSTARSSTTTFNGTSWQTTVPLSYASQADEIFAAGLAYLVPAGFQNNTNDVTWSMDVTSTAPDVDVTWQYGVSNWSTSNNGTTFPGWNGSTSTFKPDYNGMNINPVHNAPGCNGWNWNGDHAGAPEFSGRQYVCGGGYNWCGQWSGTGCKPKVCQPVCRPPLSITCPPKIGIVGEPYTGSFTASGGTMPYTFSIASGSVAPLTLDPKTGELTGTVTTPNTTLTFTGEVTDSSSPMQVATTGAPACTITFAPQRGCPKDMATSPLIGTLGAASPANFAVLNLGGQGGNVNINVGTIAGNVGVGNPPMFQQSTPSQVLGQFILGSQVSTRNIQGSHGPIVSGGGTDSLLEQAVSDAKNASASLQTLNYTPSVQAQFPWNGTVNAPLTINLIPGMENVINLSNFTLNGGNLTFNGKAGTSVVVNVSGEFQMTSGNIDVTGGMGPLDVIWNVYGTNSSVVTMPATTSVGVILAPYANLSSMNSSVHKGTVIGGYGKNMMMGHCKVENPCTQQVTPPSPQSLMVSCPTDVYPVYSPMGTATQNYYSSPVTVTGGTGPYTFKIVSGSLGELSLNSSTGVVSGELNSYTPLTFSVQVTDSQGHTGTTPAGGCMIIPID